MRHYFTKQCVTFGSALLLSLASQQAQAQTSSEVNRPPQKALFSLESNFISRWMSGEPDDKTTVAPNAPATTAPPAEPTRKALLPPNSILNRNYPPATSPSAAATPLPPTTLVVGPAPAAPLPGSTPIQQPGLMPLQQPIMLPGPRPMAAPIGTTLPPGIAQAQLVAAQSPVMPGQAPVIIVVPAGWQPEGSVSFAPRTIMSPEVPAEHWPTVERNPFGDRSDRGLFTWPKFAKQIAGATLEGQEAAVPQGPPSKALFATTNKPAEVQPPAKALFAPATAPIAPPAPESRALFARKVAPEVKPADDTKKSRALFAFGRKADPTSPVTTPTTQVADASLAPAASGVAPNASQSNTSAALDPAEAPPEAPNLSDFESVPSAAAPMPKKQEVPKPAEKKTDVAKSQMKWRAKGSPASAATVDPAKPSSGTEPAEPALPPTQIVEQVAQAPAEAPAAADKTVATEKSASETVAMAKPNVTAVPETGDGQATAPTNTPPKTVGATNAAAAAPPAANQKALFASSFFSRGTPPARHALAPSRLAATVPQVTAPARPAEKAIVPNLMAMIPGLKEAAAKEAAATTAREVAPAAAVEVPAPSSDRVAQVSTHSQTPTARLTQSYYAPAAEYSTEEPEVVEQPTTHRSTPVAASSRRKVNAQQTPEKIAEPQVESLLEGPIVTYEKNQPAVESQLERQPRQNQSGYGTPSNGARAAEQRATKTYRRLTTKDLTSGLSRPLNAINQYTKLPPTITRYTSKTTNSDLEAFEQDSRGQYAHNNEDAVTSHPPLKRAPVAQRPISRPISRQVREANESEAAAMVSDEETRPARDAAPSVVRGGRRRVVAPAVVTEQVDEEFEPREARVDDREAPPAEPEVKATRVRNKSGASVLIYSGADLSHDKGQSALRVSGIETSDKGRGNPLR